MRSYSERLWRLIQSMLLGENTEAPRFKMPTDAMLPETAYQIVHDESMMDGNARLNLATFVSTWMDERSR